MQAVLLGYGTVGKGVEKLVNTVDGLDMKAVFVLPEFEDLPYFSNDGEGLVTDPDVDVVFECLSGTEPSNTLIRKALQAGKHVITSNKATVAPNLEDYVKLAEENGGSIRLCPKLCITEKYRRQKCPEWIHCLCSAPKQRKRIHPQKPTGMKRMYPQEVQRKHR